MRITYIAEGSKEQGMGHLMNSATLANELKTRLVNCKRNIVIIDAPQVSPAEVKRHQDSGSKVVLFYCKGEANRIADIAVQPRASDIPPDMNLRRQEGKTLCFYGPRYRILRKEFYEYYSIARTGQVAVMLGGTDVLDLEQAIDQQLGDVCFLVRNCHGVARALAGASFAIVSPGFSVWEALYVGTPIIIIPQNKSQAERYGKSFTLLMPDQIYKLKDMIANKEFIYPDSKYEIGQGKEELLETILS
jgi:spore coat polysaccharide biosynthesis predicted glycosyltransferase SpsG